MPEDFSFIYELQR